MKIGALLASAALAPLVGSTSAPEEVRFTPTDDLTLVKTFEVVSEMDSEMTSEHGDSSSSSDMERRLVVTDRVVAAEDGRVLQLERTYDEIGAETEGSAEFGGETRDTSSSGSSDVEGSTVTFEWDEDEEEYLADSDEVDGDHLEDLPYDYDYTLLLPEGEVEEDDSWSLTPDDYRTLMDPWDGLPWTWENSDGETFSSDDEDDSDRPHPDTEESEDGELVVTFAGTRDEDGVTVAVFTLEGEIESERTVDMTHEFEQGTSVMHSETSETREISGEARWGLEAGHLLSIRIEVELSSVGTSENTVSFGDQEFENTSDMNRDGSIVFTASFAPPEE